MWVRIETTRGPGPRLALASVGQGSISGSPTATGGLSLGAANGFGVAEKPKMTLPPG